MADTYLFGPQLGRRAYFQGDERAELGDEGRYPPHLTKVGRKLNDAALLAALAGDVRVRPFTSTRMPKFGLDNVGSLARDLAEADRALADGAAEAEAPASLPPNAIQLGRRLAGTVDGLGCVQCHDFLGTPSLGVRAVDLGQMHTRIRWPWFRDLLVDPTSVNMNTRMTAVFVDGKSPVQDVYGGDPEQQVAALWAFLAQGDNMAPPPGIRTGEAAYEVEPLDRVRMVGVFMRDVSPKVLCVGTPEGVHFAWDMQNARLAKVWRGRFLNARGTWEGRAGALESPPSSDVFLPCADSAVAYFDPPEAWVSAPWPTDSGAMNARGTQDGFFGFHYRVDGNLIKDLVRPFDSDEGSGIARVINLEPGTKGACIRVARGDSIVQDDTPHSSGARVWRVSGPQPHTIFLQSQSLDVRVVDLDGAQELRATVTDSPFVIWSTQW